MLNRCLDPDPDHLRDLAARDPIAHHTCVRNWRNAQVAAMAFALPRIVWRHIRELLEA